MVAVALFDILARSDMSDSDDFAAMDRFAQKLVESALIDWERLKQYEQEFTPAEWDEEGRALGIARSIYELFEKWAVDAEQVLTRTRPLCAAGRIVPNAETLENAYGLVSARLKLTPELIARAMDQVRQGQIVSAKGLRDELRSRLRA